MDDNADSRISDLTRSSVRRYSLNGCEKSSPTYFSILLDTICLAGEVHVIVRRDRSWALLGLILIALMGFSSASANAQSSPLVPGSTPEQLKEKAFDLEKASRWEDALQTWCKLYGLDRQNEEAHKHIQICLRRMFQGQRLLDRSLRERVLSLSHTQSLALYAEVLTTLNTAYIDRSKVTPGRLFQQGLDEFLISLNDEKFRKIHMPEASNSAVRTFQSRLREYMAVRPVDSVADAVDLLKMIASTARRDLHLSKDKTSAVVLEFIGGACNSLDEYTSYLSPADLDLEMRPTMEPSVIVDDTFLKNGIGYFKIAHFRDTTPEEMDTAINALRMAPGGMNLRVLVMDLRGNPGGLFSAAVQVVERFIPAGVIVSTQARLEEFNKVYSSGARMNVIDLPLVVLVDGTTASAAEVLASAFRDHQRATLIGTPTYGKGSIQRVLQFSTGEELDEQGKPKPRSGGIRITLARFYSPNGQSLSGAGVTPHVLEQDKSRQLDAAIGQALRFVSAMTPR
jgi:C-terminal processing protease CtpA/Prc